MILYQDSDSIGKLYLIDEAGIIETRKAFDESDIIAASLLSYVEVRSLLSRARRTKRIRSVSQYSRLKSEFEQQWLHYVRVAPSEEIVQQAGHLAEKHGLKAYDSVHLASVLHLQSDASASIQISTWDHQLARAAEAEGLSLAHEVTN